MLKLTPFSSDTVEQVIAEAMDLLGEDGVRIHHDEGLKLFAEAGATVDFNNKIVHIPEVLIWRALGTVPFGFSLYNLDGRPAVECGGDRVQFVPGSTAVTVLQSEWGDQRPAETADMINLIKLVEALPQCDAHSIAFACRDIANSLFDLHGLYIALNFMRKPVITGIFSNENWPLAYEMLTAIAGGKNELVARPLALCEVHCTPPLLWSETACHCLIECARKGIPVQLVSTPLAGMSAPVTLAAAVVQHAAEILSGLTITQLARSGTPVIWGCAAAVTDMNTYSIPTSDISAWLIDSACMQIGKALGMATQARMSTSDAKTIDFQAGIETTGGTFLAALAGANLITGAGMIDYLRCLSFEKLVLDCEVMGMARRLIDGIEIREDPIALNLVRRPSIEEADHMYSVHTAQWYRREFYIPSKVIDRGSLSAWQREGEKNAFQRAADQAEKLISVYQPSPLSEKMRKELQRIMSLAAARDGVGKLPEIS